MKILRSSRLAYIVLGLGLIVSVGISLYSYAQVQETQRIRFQNDAEQIILLIKNRMDAYEQVLLSGAGLFYSKGDISRSEWKTFIERQNIDQTFPGIQGIGYSKIIHPDQKERHIGALRAEGFENYTIKPEGKRDLYTSIIYLEPFNERNQRAFGYDMFSEAVRHDAMLKAIESGEPQLSGKVKLLQENGVDEQAGFLMYVPVYEPDLLLNSNQQRMTAIRGFVYAPFRAKDLLEGVAGNRTNSIDLEVYDGVSQKREALLYDSWPKTRYQGASQQYQTTLAIAGRHWHVTIHPLSDYGGGYEKFYPWIFLIIGFGLSISMFLFIHSMASTKENALALAKRMTTKLSASEERLRYALEGVGDGLWDRDIVSGRVYFSDGWKRMLGFEPGEITNSLDEWATRVHPHDMEKVNIDIERCMNKEVPVYINKHRVLCKDGNYKWILDRGVIIEWSEEGKALRMIGTHTDIHESELNYQLIHQLQRRYEAFMKYASDGIYIIGLDGKLKECNRKAASMLGYSMEEMETLSVYDWDAMIPDETLPALIDSIPFENAIEFETLHRRKDGSTYDAAVTAVRIMIEEMPLIYASTRNISHEKQLQSELIKAKEYAERAAMIKSEFLANMSHEIRTPLNGVMGLMDLVLKMELEEKPRLYLTKARESSKSLLGVINDILDFSKIEAGKLQIESRSFELNHLIDTLQALFEYSMAAKSIHFQTLMDENIPRWVSGDSLRIIQVLSNLVGNAVKFTENGAVVLEIKAIESANGVMKLQFMVKDSGIGIDRTTLEKLFESFTQSDASTTRKYGGTGLGLAISKQLVELMGGEIWVESELGKGSSFYFTLSVGLLDDNEIEACEAIAIIEEEDTFLEGKVLLVDDNEVNLLVAREMLDAYQLSVDIAQNGEEAVQKASENRYDLILMDLHMPKMDGFEASAKVRKFDPDIPIIALTAAVMEHDKVLAKEAGMNDHLAKPMDSNALTQILSRYLNRSSIIPLEEPSEEVEVMFPQEIQNFDMAAFYQAFGARKPERIYSFYAVFRETFQDTPEKLLKMEPLSEEFKRTIHTLKGTGSNLKMESLAALCRTIEQEGVNEERLETLIRTLESVLEEIDRYILPVIESKEYSSMDSEELKSLISGLIDDFGNARYIERERIDRVLKVLEKVIEPKLLEQLREGIQQHQEERVNELLQEIARELK